MIDELLNRYEDEDGDGVPDVVEAAAITGVGVGMVLLGVAAITLAAKHALLGMAVALGLVISVVGLVLAAAALFDTVLG